MRIYISGPITNAPNHETAFCKAAGQIARHGHEYVNPAYLSKYIPNMDHGFYMHIAFATMPSCDAIYMLRGWNDSLGAQMEYKYALAHNMTVYEEDEHGEPVPALPTRKN